MTDASPLRRRGARALADREYRPVWHMLSVLFIIAAAFLLFYKNFPYTGTLIYTDMTWPTTLQRLSFQTYNAWVPFGSLPSVGSVMWFYWIYPSSSVAALLHIPARYYQFIMFLGTFSFAGVSMYVLSYSTIKSIKLKDKARYAPFAGAVLAALVYMYNPWSLQYFKPYFAYMIYAALPLLFMALVRTVDSPRIRNIILFSLFVALVSTVYLMFWFWGLLVSYLVFYVVTNRFARESLVKAGKTFIGVVIFYLLFNAHWAVPSLAGTLSGRPFVPYYGPVFKSPMLKALSSNNTMVNNFRLISNWAWKVDMAKGGRALDVLLFAIPVLTILSLVLLRKNIRRNRVVNYWAIVALLGLLLATGTSFILSRVYDYFAFRAPGSSAYGWILRSPDRWLFFVPLFFALMIGLLLANLLVRNPHPVMLSGFLGRRPPVEDEKESPALFDPDEPPAITSGPEAKLSALEHTFAIQRFRRSQFSAAIVVILVLVSMYPVTMWFARNVFNQAQVPKDYEQVNAFLAKQPNEPRVMWLPFVPSSNFVYKWAPEKNIFPPQSFVSSNPALSNIQEVMNDDSYFNWMQSLYIQGTLPPVLIVSPTILSSSGTVSKLSAPFAASYVIVDTSVRYYDFGESLASDPSLTLVFSTKYLRVYKTDFDPGYISAATKLVQVDSLYDNLSISQKLGHEALKSLAFLDGRSFFGSGGRINKKYDVLDMKNYLIPLTFNGDFHIRKPNGQPDIWYLTHDNGKTTVSVDINKRVKNSNSLKMVNESATQYDLSALTTWEEPVKAGNTYTFEVSARSENAEWTYALIEGHRNDNDQWESIINCPNIAYVGSGWKKFRCSIAVPKGYSAIRPALVAGWAKDKDKGPGVSWFDNVMLSKVSSDFFGMLAPSPQQPRLTYTRVTAEKYTVRVRGATRPFVLSLSEAYDNHWIVKTSKGKTIRSVPLYSATNGFPIEDTGNYTLTIEYEAQRWVNSGLAISIVSILLALLYLTVVMWRRKTLEGATATAGDALRSIGSRVFRSKGFPPPVEWK